MSAASRTEILMWAERVIARKGGPAYALLDLTPTSGAHDAQAAFHNIARSAHPDLHRNSLTPDELERVTSAYAAVAGAYMEMRSQAERAARITGAPPIGSAPRPHGATQPPPTGGPAPRPHGATRPPPTGGPAPRPGGVTRPPPVVASGNFPEFLERLSSANAAQQMTPKAITYFRKAEAALKRGDLKSAMLQIKLAVAADPSSAFLRTALAEVDAELRRTA